MIIVRKSQLTGKVHEMEMDVTPEQIDNYMKGGLLIQDAFPSLTNSEREFIMTGITDAEWEEFVGKDEEEE